MAELDSTPTASTRDTDQPALVATPQSLQPPTSKPQKPRRTIIEAACNQCRQKKSKCDGARPCCGRCAPKGLACAYEIEEGQTRVGSLKTRYVALVKENQHMLDFMQTLRAAPMDEVLSIINVIRAAHQGEAQKTIEGKRPHSPTPESSSPSSIDDTCRPTKRRGGLQTPGGTPAFSSESSHTTPRSIPTSSAEPSYPVTAFTPAFPNESSSSPAGDTRHSNHREPPEMDQRHSDTFSSKVGELPESDHSPTTGFQTFDKEDFELALDAYNTSVGALFYVYAPQQVSRLFENVFGPYKTSGDASFCQLCAIAALGSFYSNGTVSTSIGEDFYNMAKHYLNALIREDVLAGMKACAILAMVNIVTKSTMTLTFLDLGLSLAEKSGLENRNPPPEISRVQWLDSKRVWRTLVLCSGWVSSTIGVISNQNWRSNCAALQQMDFDGDAHISDVVQTEMAKIASLKANILRAVTTFKSLSPGVISSISKDLRGWHENLPPVMCLANIRDVETSNQHKIYFVHVLYLGALMLLQRCIMSRWFVEKMDPATQMDITEEASECIRDGYSAARQSARLLGLLKQEGGAVKRCWLCTYQSHASGMLMIHESYQKLLYGTETQAALDESLALIDQSIEVLKFCASDDAVAHDLLRTSKPHYDTLKQVRAMHVHKFTNHADSSGLPSIQISRDLMLRNAADQLLVLICRPFGDLPGSVSGLEGTKDNYIWRQQKSLAEMAFGTYLDWQWDAVQDIAEEGEYRPGTSPKQACGVPCSELLLKCDLAPTNRFLDSNRPSGWSTDPWGNIKLHEQRTAIS